MYKKNFRECSYVESPDGGRALVVETQGQLDWVNNGYRGCYETRVFEASVFQTENPLHLLFALSSREAEDNHQDAISWAMQEACITPDPWTENPDYYPLD